MVILIPSKVKKTGEVNFDMTVFFLGDVQSKKNKKEPKLVL